jgi:hypothetical protein
VITPPDLVRVVEQEDEGKKHSPRDGRDPRYGTPAARRKTSCGEQQQQEGREGKCQRSSQRQQSGYRSGGGQRSGVRPQGVGGVGFPQQLEGEPQTEAQPQPSVGVLGAARGYEAAEDWRSDDPHQGDGLIPPRCLPSRQRRRQPEEDQHQHRRQHRQGHRAHYPRQPGGACARPTDLPIPLPCGCCHNATLAEDRLPSVTTHVTRFVFWVEEGRPSASHPIRRQAMYACVNKSESDFSRGCAHPAAQPPISTTHPTAP